MRLPGADAGIRLVAASSVATSNKGAGSAPLASGFVCDLRGGEAAASVFRSQGETSTVRSSSIRFYQDVPDGITGKPSGCQTAFLVIADRGPATSHRTARMRHCPRRSCVISAAGAYWGLSIRLPYMN